ncbi:MAG: hypothetical protein ABSH48_27035, partial [Verrucomicrobiota bacterium]
MAEWYFENTAGTYNGYFDITATKNLQGNISWDLAIPASQPNYPQSVNLTGTVYIGAVPEAPATGIFMGVG